MDVRPASDPAGPLPKFFRITFDESVNPVLIFHKNMIVYANAALYEFLAFQNQPLKEINQLIPSEYIPAVEFLSNEKPPTAGPHHMQLLPVVHNEGFDIICQVVILSVSDDRNIFMFLLTLSLPPALSASTPDHLSQSILHLLPHFEIDYDFINPMPDKSDIEFINCVACYLEYDFKCLLQMCTHQFSPSLLKYLEALAVKPRLRGLKTYYRILEARFQGPLLKALYRNTVFVRLFIPKLIEQVPKKKNEWDSLLSRICPEIRGQSKKSQSLSPTPPSLRKSTARLGRLNLSNPEIQISSKSNTSPLSKLFGDREEDQYSSGYATPQPRDHLTITSSSGPDQTSFLSSIISQIPEICSNENLKEFLKICLVDRPPVLPSHVGTGFLEFLLYSFRNQTYEVVAKIINAELSTCSNKQNLPSNSLTMVISKELWELGEGHEFERQVLATIYADLASVDLLANPQQQSFQSVVSRFLDMLYRSLPLWSESFKDLFAVLGPTKAWETRAVYFMKRDYTKFKELYQIDVPEKQAEIFWIIIDHIAKGNSSETYGSWLTSHHKPWAQFWSIIASKDQFYFAPSHKALIREVQAQIHSEIPQFGLFDPVLFHLPISSLLVHFWSLMRESLIAKTHLKREHKEVFAIFVSQSNNSPHCIQSNVITLNVTNPQVLELICKNNLDQIADKEMQQMAQFAAIITGRDMQAVSSCQNPLQNIKLAEAIAIIGLFDYLCKVTAVQASSDEEWPASDTIQKILTSMMEGTPVKLDLPQGLSFRFCNLLSAREAGGVALRPRLQLLSKLGSLGRAICLFDREIRCLQFKYIPSIVTNLLRLQLSKWNLEKKSGSWAEDLVTQLIQEGHLDQEYAEQVRISLLVALSPELLTNDTKKKLSVEWGEQPFTALCVSAAWEASSRRMELVIDLLLKQDNAKSDNNNNNHRQ